MSEVTLLLEAAKAGKPGAENELWQVVYNELRSMAGGMMHREQREVTLSGTSLLHEAWLRLSGPGGASLPWESRSHFFAAAAEAMRRILVDQARYRLRRKRGGNQPMSDLAYAAEVSAPDDDKLLLVHEILDEMAQSDPQKAEIVKLRFFVGLTHEEIAGLLGVNEKTVRRQWKMAKIWLYHALKGMD